MNNANSALSDAQEATKLDPTYAKGFYRQGMAQLKLNNRSAAKQSFLQGIALVPDDKDFRQQLDKLLSGFQKKRREQQRQLHRSLM
jgi:tetratricopeptide (TPR) repeat protein